MDGQPAREREVDQRPGGLAGEPLARVVGVDDVADLGVPVGDAVPEQHQVADHLPGVAAFDRQREHLSLGVDRRPDPLGIAEPLAHLRHPGLRQLRFRRDERLHPRILLRRELAHLLGDLHRAELGPAHRAEVR